MTGPAATNDCASIADRLPELALGILGGAERAEVLDHLDRCSSCREASADWAATVDVLPSVLAEAEPPPGFASRAFELVHADQDRVPRWSLTRRVLSIAAVVAFVMIGTLAAVRIIDAGGSDSPSSTVRSAQMVGYSGRWAGDVFLTSGRESYVFLDVSYGVQTGTYRIEVVDAADRATALGTVEITSGHGAWAGELAASKGGDGDAPAMVRLVDSNGNVLCSARFGAVAS